MLDTFTGRDLIHSQVRELEKEKTLTGKFHEMNKSKEQKKKRE